MRVEQQEHGQFACGDAGWPQVLAVEGVELDESALEQVREPSAEVRPELRLAWHALSLLLA